MNAEINYRAGTLADSYTVIYLEVVNIRSHAQE